jgi:hypothetical protein
MSERARACTVILQADQRIWSNPDTRVWETVSCGKCRRAALSDTSGHSPSGGLFAEIDTTDGGFGFYPEKGLACYIYADHFSGKAV